MRFKDGSSETAEFREFDCVNCCWHHQGAAVVNWRKTPIKSLTWLIRLLDLQPRTSGVNAKHAGAFIFGKRLQRIKRAPGYLANVQFVRGDCYVKSHWALLFGKVSKHFFDPVGEEGFALE